jgi:hypothetical protein
MQKIFNKSFLKILFTLVFMFIGANICSAAITVTVTASPSTVTYGAGSQISWTSSGATSCSESGGRGGSGTTGSFYVSNLYASTTFNVTCVGLSSPTNYYFKLAHCTSSNVFQTGPFPSGTYGTGEVLAGALDNGAYDYRVVDSSPTPFPGLTNIMTSRTGGYMCRPIH